MSQIKPVIILLGPTGSGKSGLAMALGEMLLDRYPIELVCMDSMQVYSELKIGNTAPSAEELKAIPHHLFGCVSIRENFSSVKWLELAKKSIEDIHARGKTPVFVGGTGLYHRMLTEGVSRVPTTPFWLRDRLEQRARDNGAGSLYHILKNLDPDGAKHLHEHDQQRVQRFLEVYLTSGRPMTDFWEEGRDSGIDNPVLTLGLEVPRDLLLKRLSSRLEEMFRMGWVQEVSDLAKQGHRQAIENHGPIGYQILFEAMDGGKTTWKEAFEKIEIATRQYAKRQMTWFRSVSGIQWFRYYQNTGYNSRRMFSKIVEFMENGWNG